jgi:hypothetical protein
MTMHRGLLAVCLLLLACRRPADATVATEAPAAEDTGSVVAPAPIHPACAALLPPTAWTIVERKEERVETLGRLVSGGHVEVCDAASDPRRVAAGSDEAAYCRAAIQAELCGDEEEVRRAIEDRTRAFPDSPDAWLAFARLQFSPLQPGGDSLPYNENLPSAERLRIANEVLATLRRVDRLRPDDARVYGMMSAAYGQRQFARRIVRDAITEAEKLEAQRAREDWELAGRALKKACTLARQSPCPPEDPERRDLDLGDEQEEIPEEEFPDELDALGASTGPRRIDSSTLPAVADADAVQITPEEGRALAIYSPDPDPELLSATRAAKKKKPVTGVVRYCVDARGRTLGIESRPPGDPQIDRILRDTVAGWRFRPWMVDGEPKTACTTVTFDLRFGG